MTTLLDINEKDGLGLSRDMWMRGGSRENLWSSLTIHLVYGLGWEGRSVEFGFEWAVTARLLIT